MKDKHMKRIWSLLVILALGFISTTIGINYFIYWQVNQYCRQHPDRIKMETIQWDWKGVYVTNAKSSNPHFHHQFQAHAIFLFHDWLDPFKLQVRITNLDAPQVKVETANCSITYDDSLVSTQNLLLKNISLTLQRKGSRKIHEVEVKVPLIKSTFQYQLKTSDLNLTAGVPSFENSLLNAVSIRANGNIRLLPKADGKVDLHVKGISQIINLLIQNNIIKKKKASLFILGAQLMGGQNDESNIPLSFDNGSVYLGPFPIFERK